MGNALPKTQILEKPATALRRVAILDDVVVNQIAAGEVVERPASVVKELLENAIDAKASEITIVADNGGQSQIQVIDNGHGMSREDALLAIQRYGTSKIRTADDLSEVITLGFRGEALPSIASVSYFSLTTRAESGKGMSEAGTEITIEGGKIENVQDRNRPIGTTVTVRQLFFNIPARRRFLRTEGTEAAAIRGVVLDYALAYPRITFKLILDGRNVFHAPGNADLLERAHQLKVAGENPLTVHGATIADAGKAGVEPSNSEPRSLGSIIIRGAISRPINAGPTANRLRIIVNGRVVRDRMLIKALRDGYGNFLKPGRHPIGVIELTIPATDVDVNVHPQKSEVRFRTPEVLYRFVRSQVHRALGALPPQESINHGVPPAWGAGAVGMPPVSFPLSEQRQVEAIWEGNIAFNSESVERSSPPSIQVASSAALFPESRELRTIAEVRNMRFVGQLFRCYLVFEGAESVAMVDMHAAHERVVFYRLRKALNEAIASDGAIAHQNLLVPEIVTLAPDQAEHFREIMPALVRFGLNSEFLEGDQVIVRSLPTAIGNCSAKALIDEMLATPEWGGWDGGLDRRFDAVLARIACHGSIRRGRELEREEAYELLSSLEHAELSGYCPHGRPIIRMFSEREFEEMFGRV